MDQINGPLQDSVSLMFRVGNSLEEIGNGAVSFARLELERREAGANPYVVHVVP